MSTELATVDTGNQSLDVIRKAIESKADPGQLREIYAIWRDMDADNARRVFNLAISDFQRRAPIIEKADRAYDKQYARMDRIWREIRPLLTELGLSVTWQVCELRGDGTCHIEGQLRHKAGHGERLVRDIPMPELLKGQNKAQQAGSASTYAQRYALCGALGVVTGDDDDGHAAATQFVTKEQAATIADMLDACRGLPDFNEAAFWKFAGVERGRTDLIAANRLNDVLGSLERKLKGPAK
jgi:hypothetical protein